MQLKHSSLSL
ncbi:hypothetical protein HFV01_25720 [Limnospira fusiformis SAG 85.79]|nr:hypothetical protein HFV01_25720 [Limnospira fusiformis SAG 85.79]QNH60102.1 MAG: hypothetical protein H2674_01515 [Limnospira indica BM01]